MDTLTIEAWCKPGADSQSIPVGLMKFTVDEQYHLALEEAEQQLEDSGDSEAFVDVDLMDLDLSTSGECGSLADCQFRVYLGGMDKRGQFHLVGHRSSDGTLVYSNAVMVESLG
ncbi:Uncharacterised protein [BD1-7 clade bacterium]|uniref:Uncharacterized protein n=1 Tax=BD1-7 clade bacterium TaxID=2029982 RepID=A0A5S9NVK3_9GAMM|nr:Uncharacterised protein [BD1-7 clade bacterium]CAA0095462.1 Uncharacterised protein [BD1-7 clade bacterium]